MDLKAMAGFLCGWVACVLAIPIVVLGEMLCGRSSTDRQSIVGDLISLKADRASVVPCLGGRKKEQLRDRQLSSHNCNSQLGEVAHDTKGLWDFFQAFREREVAEARK